jgi:hypothetical protein
MNTKEQLEGIVFHQTQCITAIDDLKEHIQEYKGHEDYAINKLQDIEKELKRLTIQLKEIEKKSDTNS